MRRETIQRWAAASIPLLAMLLVFAFGVLFHGAITDGTPKLLSDVFSPGCGGVHVPSEKEAPGEAARLNFAAASQLLFVVQIAVSIAGLGLLWQRTEGRKRILFMGGTVLLGLMTATLPREQYSPINVEFVKIIEGYCPRILSVVMNQERCGAFATAILTCSLSVLLIPRREKDVADLSRRFERLSWILYAGTALLVVSVARLDALYNWTAAAAEANIQKGIPPVSASVLRMWGVFYATLLGAIYLPAYLWLRAEAEELADEHSETERRSWLEQHGLALSVADVLRRFAAIIAPILAGEANKVFKLL